MLWVVMGVGLFVVCLVYFFFKSYFSSVIIREYVRLRGRGCIINGRRRYSRGIYVCVLFFKDVFFV